MHPDRNTWNRQQNTVFSIFFFFPVINSLREHPFFSALVSSLFFGVREATTWNTSAVRRLVQFKKLRTYRKENADLRHENIIVMAFLMWIKTNSCCLRLSLSNLRSGSIFVSLWKLHSGGGSRRENAWEPLKLGLISGYSLSVTSRFKLRVPSSPSKKN